MQKVVYLSNSRDYTEQGDINENKYFTRLNKLLEDGWVVASMSLNEVKIINKQDHNRSESFAAFVLLTRPGEEEDEDK